MQPPSASIGLKVARGCQAGHASQRVRTRLRLINKFIFSSVGFAQDIGVQAVADQRAHHCAIAAYGSLKILADGQWETPILIAVKDDRLIEALTAQEWQHPITGEPVRLGYSTIERLRSAAGLSSETPVSNYAR